MKIDSRKFQKIVKNRIKLNKMAMIKWRQE